MNKTASKKKRRFNFLKVGRIVGMVVITVFALLVMVAMNLKGRNIEAGSVSDSIDNQPSLVAIEVVGQDDIELTQKYSGTIRPLERFALAFKSAGRVSQLGLNEDGLALDEGDIVQAGQVLAKLDVEVLKKQILEIKAREKFAQDEYERAAKLKSNEGAISDSEFSIMERELAVAEAQVNALQTQIDDAVLRSPIDGVIARRLVKPGEAIALGQAVFDVIQVSMVKLVVGIPESRIHRLLGRDLKKNPPVAHVSLIGRGGLESAIPVMDGKVVRISQTSDDKSGLFDVEILLDNGQSRLRPGMIAIAEIVVDRVDGFRIPVDAVFVREQETFVFAAERVLPDAGDAGANPEGDEKEEPDGGSNQNAENQTPIPYVARKHVLPEGSFEFQGDVLIATGLPVNRRAIVTRGHRRLVDGRRIEIVNPDQLPLVEQP